MASVFELFGEIAINAESAYKTIDSTTSKAEGLTKTFGKVGSAAVKFGKVVAAGSAAAAAGLGVIIKKSIGEFAEYEQLVGGVETLFKESSGKVLEYANNAFRDAGLSANDYMSTVTSFSASLLQSLDGDTERAADLANKALIDMSDNANKMGSDMSMIQNAYQGFAKQNYTMLDNLKLGYGGTKSEMERLLADASKLAGQKFDISNFSDVIEAIHTIQEEMGVAGATAEEASETISGSFGALKASFSNLITGLANDNADIDLLVDNLVEAGKTYAKNIKKVLPGLAKNLRTAALGLWDSFSEAFEGLGEKVPGWISNIQQKISSAWKNKVYPTVQNLFKTKLGVDLPDWDTLVTDVSNAWNNSVVQNIQDKIKAKLGIEPPDLETAVEQINEWWNGDGSLYSKLKSVLVWTLGTFVPPATEVVTESVQSWWDGVKPSLTKITQWTFFEVVLPSWTDFLTDVTEWWENTVKPGLKDVLTLEVDFKLPTFDSIKDWFSDLFDMYKTGGAKFEDPNATWVWDEETSQPIKLTPAEGTESEIQSTIDGYNLEGEADLHATANSGANLQSYLNGLDLVAKIRLVGSGAIEGFGDDAEADGSHASGLDRVPFDGYRAILHKDEAVLKASEAAVYRGEKKNQTGRRNSRDANGSGQVVNVTQNIQAVPMTPAELAAQTKFALGMMRFSV